MFVHSGIQNFLSHYLIDEFGCYKLGKCSILGIVYVKNSLDVNHVVYFNRVPIYSDQTDFSEKLTCLNYEFEHAIRFPMWKYKF